MKLKKVGFAIAIVFMMTAMVSTTSEAKINFNALEETQIDLNKLKISKSDFFAFISNLVNTRPEGLGKYGRIPFRACDYELNDRKLIDYTAPNGRGNQFLSNPSCDQLVIRRVLEVDYNYTMENIGDYGNRKCILSVEKIFSPMLEYYAIIYDEKTKPDCSGCDQKETNRLAKIEKSQRQINADCDTESENVIRFLEELDQVIEKAYQHRTK